MSELNQNVLQIGVRCRACDTINLKEASWFQTKPDSLVCSDCDGIVPVGRLDYEHATAAIESRQRQMGELQVAMDLANKRLRGGRQS